MCEICKTIEKSLRRNNPYLVREMKTSIVVIGWNQHFYSYTLFICKRRVTKLYESDLNFELDKLI